MKNRSMIVTGLLLAGLLSFSTTPILIQALQLPSGWLAAFFLGAPSCVDGDLVRIFTTPQVTISQACSGVRFFILITALGGGYWCGTKIRRWLLLFPVTYLIAVHVNAARISMIWQFRRFSAGLIPEWLQQHGHMGIGIVCFLSVITVLFYWCNRNLSYEKETLK